MPVAHKSDLLQSFRDGALRLDTPDVVGALTVFPILGDETSAVFLSFAEAASLGARVTELTDGASVNDLRVDNPLDVAVLLFEGEEVLGAQQNRTFDATILVAAGSQITVPVSCVEHGRWDGTQKDAPFAASPQTAYPALRREKNVAARGAAAMGHEARADQSAVWAEVDRKTEELCADAPTQAMHDVFAGRDESLAQASAGITRRPGQLGAIAAVEGSPLVLDWVGRADVYAALHGPLVRGYALDGLSSTASVATGPAVAEAWLQDVLATPAVRRRTPGAGTALHFAGPAAQGSGLALEQELLAFCAFPGERREAGAIRRPSRRR